MIANNKKLIIVSSLIVIEIISVVLMVLSLKEKVLLENIEADTKEVSRNGLAIMVEQDDGSYTNQTSLPSKDDGYVFNADRSGCIDSTGNIIANAITYNKTTNSVTVESDVSLGCYLYFDKLSTAVEHILATASEEELWDSTLEDDGYRYVGTNPNNYVCFGYSDEETDCDFTNATNTDLYAYRVIGIFEDTNGVEHVKLIKKEALNDIYDGMALNELNELNASLFLTNNTYFQDTSWANKIAIWNYALTNSSSREPGSLTYDVNTIQETYLHEMNRSTNTNTIGTWETFTNKISLMYVSDYLLSLGNTEENQDFKTSWMTVINNDNNMPDTSNDLGEWTMSVYAPADETTGLEYYLINYQYFIDEEGDVYITREAKGGLSYMARPVFYLTSDTTMSGEGTLESPFVVYK